MRVKRSILTYIDNIRERIFERISLFSFHDNTFSERKIDRVIKYTKDL